MGLKVLIIIFMAIQSSQFIFASTFGLFSNDVCYILQKINRRNLVTALVKNVVKRVTCQTLPIRTGLEGAINMNNVLMNSYTHALSMDVLERNVVKIV